MNWFARLVLTSLTILAVPYVVSGVQVDGFGTALLAAALLGFLNVTVKPLLILFTLPLTLLSFGFFLLIVNALVFEILGGLLPGLHVDSFGSAFLAALMVSIVSWALQINRKEQGGKRVFVVHGAPPPPSGERRTRDLN